MPALADSKKTGILQPSDLYVTRLLLVWQEITRLDGLVRSKGIGGLAAGLCLCTAGGAVFQTPHQQEGGRSGVLWLTVSGIKIKRIRL